MTKIIYLQNGGHALVDDEDFAAISSKKWRRHTLGYAYRAPYVDGKQRLEYMHRVIMGNPDTARQKLVVDHINNNKLDNRRANLRLLSKSLNGINGKDPERGIYFDKTRKRWTARISRHGKTMHLGRFRNRADAIAARRRAEAEIFQTPI